MPVTDAVAAVAGPSGTDGREAWVLRSGGALERLRVRPMGEGLEVVWSLPVVGLPTDSGWTAADLFDPLGQPYAHCGISVNSFLQPIDGNGKIILQNLFIAGRGLAGRGWGECG